MGVVRSPLPGEQLNNSSLDAAAARPGTRKSQIIEEEEDMEDLEEEEYIEEVDEFDPADEVIPGSPDEIIKPQTPITDTPEHAAETSSPSSRKPVLAPAPDLESSPLRPPRSSSLRAPRRPGTATTLSADDAESNEAAPQDKDNDKENAASEKASAFDGEAATANPAT
jgi:hypothetical protein